MDDKAKLDLAIAYAESGDFSGARELLEELACNGNAEARKRLERLLQPRTSAPTSAGSPPPHHESPRRAEPPANSGRPSVHIDEAHSGGWVEEGVKPPPVPTIIYSIVDGESGAPLTPEEFSTYKAAEAFVERHFADRERWLPPPASEEEHAQLLRILDYMEKDGPKRWQAGANGSMWAHLSYYLHQHAHRPEVLARVKAVLEGNPYD